MAFSGVTVSTATSSIVDPNNGKFQSYKQRITGGETTGIGDTINADATLTAAEKSELLTLIMSTRIAANADSSRAKLAPDSESLESEEDIGQSYTGAAGGFGGQTAPVVTVDNINQEPPKLEDETALIFSSSDPLADVPSVPVETDQDVANKYIEAIKADPLGKVITVDGKALAATTPAVQRLVSNYKSSPEHNRLVTAAQSALTPTVNVSQSTRETLGATGPTKDPNENREGYYQSPSSLTWVPIPPNPGGLDWTFNYQTESWGPPPVEPVADDPPTPTEPTLPTLIEGVDIELSSEQTDQLFKAFGRGGEEEFNRVLAEIKKLNAQAALPPANNPYAFQEYQQRIGEGELSGEIGDDIYADPNLTPQQKTDLLKLISNTRANNAAAQLEETENEETEIIGDTQGELEDHTVDPGSLVQKLWEKGKTTIEDIKADPNAFREGYAKHPYTRIWTEIPPNDKGEGATWNQASWRWDAAPGVGGEGDSSLPPVDEGTVDVDVTPEQPGLPPGFDTETGDTSGIEDPNVGREGYYKRPSSGRWELAPPMPEEMIPGSGAIYSWDMPTFDPESWTWKAAESREAFLSRMPAVPGSLDLDGAMAWLSDQEGVTEEDVKRWRFWFWYKYEDEPMNAGETKRTPTEEPVEPIETLLARLPTVPSSMSNVPGMTWLIEQGVSEEDAQRWLGWANETKRVADDAEQPDLGDGETEDTEEIDATAGTGFDSLVANAGVELNAQQLARLRKAFNDGGPVRFESVLNQIKGTDFLGEEPVEEPLTEVGTELDVTLEEEEESLTEFGTDLDVTLEEEESLEAFLARLPAIPSDLSNFDAFQLLADSVNAGTISGDDALRWYQWAKENRDDPAEAWKDETTPTEPTEAETIQNKIRTSQDFLTHQAGGLGDPGSPHRELTAQEISLLEGAYRSGGEAAYNALLKDIIKSKQDNYASIMGEGKDVIPERSLEDYASISPYLDGERAKYLIEQPLLGLNDDQVIRAGEVLNADGEDALAGYIKAFQDGTLEEWETNYAEVLADREGDRAEAGDEVIVDSLYTPGTPEYEAAIANISIEDILLKIPEPPAGLDILERVFWLTDQVDAEGNPLLSPHEAMVYAEWAREQQANTDANTSVEGEGGMGNAGDPANLESIQSTIATEIENTVQDMGFNSEEYKASQTTAIEDRYGDARLRLGRQFAIDPGGPKTGRAQRQFELLENQRIQDLAALDSEVQDRLQAARDSTITNLVNAFSTITTGKMAEEQLDEQQRQFNTELRETVRQFNNDIAIRLKEFGLSETEIEAAIKKINSDIVNNTRAISADISQAWADVTGDVGVPGGLLSLEDLGIPKSEWAMFPYMPPSEDMKNSIRMSFSAMLGRDITDGELNNLIANGRINVEDNMPTQKAKEFAATIMQQNMERISKYDAIAAENGLDRDKFNDAKERADKEWNRINLEVAEQYGLDSNKFRNAMWDLDQRLTDVFFNPDLTEEQRIQQREDAINNVIISHGYQERQEQGAFLQAKDQYDLLYGDRERAIATSFGIDGETFARANRQADQAEKNMLDVWASLIKGGQEIKTYAPVGPDALPADESTFNAADAEQRGIFRKLWDNKFKITTATILGGPAAGAAATVYALTDPDRPPVWDNIQWSGEWGDYFLGSLQDSVKDVYGDNAGALLYVPGHEFNSVTAANDFVANASDEQKQQVNDLFASITGGIGNDQTLLRNMTSYFDSLKGERLDDGGTRPFNISYISDTWFADLDDTTQSAIMSFLSGSNFSSEREAGGVSALSSIGRAFGIGVGAAGGAYLAYATGNTDLMPAATAAGASAGAAATGG